jgi:hypothetical protein
MKISEILEGKCCPDEVLLEDSPVEPIVEALYQGKTVELNKPFRTAGGPRKFAVYVKNDKGNIIKVNFGDPNATIKNNDPKAAASFQARHRCSEQKDKTSAAYWSCNVARYAKSLGLSSSRPW